MATNIVRQESDIEYETTVESIDENFSQTADQTLTTTVTNANPNRMWTRTKGPVQHSPLAILLRKTPSDKGVSRKQKNPLIKICLKPNFLKRTQVK